MSEESPSWLVSINFTSHELNLNSRKIIYFTSSGENSQKCEQKTDFKPTWNLNDPRSRLFRNSD